MTWFGGIAALFTPVFGLFATMPAGGTYQLKSYDFGTGGGESSSANYRLDSSTGTLTGNGLSATYENLAGLMPTQNANTPPAPAVTNPDNYYNKLRITLATGGNPTDTRYLIAISDDDFVTTAYVQSDTSIASSYDLADYLTYAGWGGASGFLVLGLEPSTTYKVKVSAWQGRFTESGFGPTATAATVATSISFGVTTTLTSTPPFSIDFSSLAPNSVFDADADTLIAFATNAENGAAVYIQSLNAGLASAQAGYTLPSATADLSSAARGYGSLVTSAAQSSGGPFTAESPFNSAGNNVGGLLTTLQTVLRSSGPIGGGTATMRTKAKTDITVPSTNDYTDRHTYITAAMF